MIDTNLNTFNQMYAALKKPKMNFALKLYTLFFNGTTSKAVRSFQILSFFNYKTFSIGQCKASELKYSAKVLTLMTCKNLFSNTTLVKDISLYLNIF